MSEISLEGMVGKPVGTHRDVFILDRQPTPTTNTTIDEITSENPPQPIETGNRTARERLSGFYERAKGAVSQIKPKVLRGVGRVALPITLAGVLAACSAVDAQNPYMLPFNNAKPLNTSQGVKVIYPPDFSCYKIAYGGDFGERFNMRGLERAIPHPGVDILGKIVIAPADGTVRVINYINEYGYQVSLSHTEEDLDIAGAYSITWFSHLKKSNGQNSALKYVKIGQRVKKGQPIAEPGNTGEWAGPIEHLHWTVYVAKKTWPIDNFNSGNLANNHDWWGPHSLDKPGEKYIPFISEGENYQGPKAGFIYPILCPSRKKISLDNGSGKPLEIALNFDYHTYGISGLDLESFRKEVASKLAGPKSLLRLDSRLDDSMGSGLNYTPQSQLRKAS